MDSRRARSQRRLGDKTADPDCAQLPLELDQRWHTDPGLAWAQSRQLRHVAGVDEAGRGPLAGPVCAAAVILDPGWPIDGIDDSKRLRPARRRQLAELIREHSLAWAVAFAEVEEIDAINILQATRRAMKRAVEALDPACDGVLVDGNQRIDVQADQLTVIQGDRRCRSIAAASILAKTARDQRLHELEHVYPGYGFAQHKGYGTAAHLAALAELGPCPQHRQSFAPVRRARDRHGG